MGDRDPGRLPLPRPPLRGALRVAALRAADGAASGLPGGPLRGQNSRTLEVFLIFTFASNFTGDVCVLEVLAG